MIISKSFTTRGYLYSRNRKTRTDYIVSSDLRNLEDWDLEGTMELRNCKPNAKSKIRNPATVFQSPPKEGEEIRFFTESKDRLLRGFVHKPSYY